VNFEPTDDRRMLADSLARFLREQYAFPVRQRIAASPTGCDRRMWQQFAELGVLAALFTEEQGGFGGSGFDIALVFEAMGRALVVEPLAGALMAGQALAAAGTPAARGALEQLIAGSRIVLLALEEGDTGADPRRVALRAQRAADGKGWRLDGRKSVLAQAEAADAFVLAARTAGRPGDDHGLSLFLVPAASAGLARRGVALVDGGRGAELVLEQVALPAEALLGQVDGALPVLEHAIGCGLLALAAESLGAMEVAKQATLEYLQTRKQFGVPIGSFQALQHRMADLLLEVEQARSSVINAAAALQGMAVGGDPLDRGQREQTLSAAKYTVGRAGIRVAEESIQLHGGIGMSWELPLPHYAKRLVLIDHELGDEDEHLARYLALR
jgi:alkylation response protein AidB-like acyl-CoA dehydrogenase